MAIFDPLKAIGQVLLPKSLQQTGVAVGNPVIYNSNQTTSILAGLPTTQHLRDLISERRGTADNDLIQTLMTYDPDVGAAVNAYLTLANQTMRYLCKDSTGAIDVKAQSIIDEVVMSLGNTDDYTKGFVKNRSIHQRNADFRYMVLMRGSIAAELVLDKNFGVTDLSMVDTKTLSWISPTPNKLQPQQRLGSTTTILDIPTFYYASFRQDPTSPYSKSFFISVINSVYARLQMINDLYDIMKITGYPRIGIELIEEVIVKSMPEPIRNDPEQRVKYISDIIGQTQSEMARIRPDQPIVHTDSVKVSMINDKQASMSLNINPIIETLNSQNQTALRSMATILGRGTSGVNTASVEARIFSMSAAEINDPLADIWSQALTFALRLTGSLSVVEVTFDAAEMRPPNELEPANVMKQARLQKDLSLGLITTEYYYLQMYNTLPPAGTPDLSGTNFLTPAPAASATGGQGGGGKITETMTTPQSKSATAGTGNTQVNPVQKQATNPADKSAQSNTVK